MIPYVVIDQITFGPITIYTWGLMVALGFIAGILIALKEAKKKGVSQNEVLNIAIIGFVCAFIGSRILFVVESWAYFSENFFEIFQIWKGGLSFLGGILGVVVGGGLYVKIKKLDFWKMADVFSFGAPLGFAIGRIGCFLIHDHLGHLMKWPLPWGVNYYDGVRHEAALYSIVLNLGIFFALIFLRKKIPFKGGIFLSFIFMYSVGRYIIDIFRAIDLPQSDPRYLGMTVAQYISLVLFFISSVILWKKNKKFNRHS